MENPNEAPLLKFSTEVSRNDKQSLQTHAASTSPFEDLFLGAAVFIPPVDATRASVECQGPS